MLIAVSVWRARAERCLDVRSLDVVTDAADDADRGCRVVESDRRVDRRAPGVVESDCSGFTPGVWPADLG